MSVPSDVVELDGYPHAGSAGALDKIAGMGFERSWFEGVVTSGEVRNQSIPFLSNTVREQGRVDSCRLSFTNLAAAHTHQSLDRCALSVGPVPRRPLMQGRLGPFADSRHTRMQQTCMPCTRQVGSIANLKHTRMCQPVKRAHMRDHQVAHRQLERRATPFWMALGRRVLHITWASRGAVALDPALGLQVQRSASNSQQ